MDEKRKAQRLDLDVAIELDRIDGGDTDTDKKLINVEVINLSRKGIGFITKHELTIDSIYATKIQIWTKEVITLAIKIVRCSKEGDSYCYGASFVGITEKDALDIDYYQMFFESEERNG